MNAFARTTAAVLLLGLAAAGAAKDDVPPLDVPSGADLTGAPRAAELGGGRIAVASPVAGGVDVVVSETGNARFGAPVAALRRDDLLVGGRRGPRIAAAGSAVVVAAATRRTKAGGGDLLAWTSKDAGATWTGPVRANDVPGCAAEGLFDLAALGDGRFVLVWLDCREKGMRLRADFSADGAGWGEDVLAYESPSGSICECCHPAAAATADGGAVVAFRNSVKGERDVWTLRLAKGATKFEKGAKSGKGSWKLAACPMAGPAVDLDHGDVVAAWRRENDVFVAFGAGNERDLGPGTEPALVAVAAGVHVLWTQKDALFDLAPDATAVRPVASDAALPSAFRVGGRGCVVWLDVAKRRARLAFLD